MNATPHNCRDGNILPPRDILEIGSAQDVVKARSANRLLGRPRIRAVHIEAARLADAEKGEFETRIRRLFNVCGCATTALVFLCALCLSGLYFELLSDFAWVRLAAAFGLSVLFAMLAKLIVLAFSRWRLNRLLASLMTRYPTTRTEAAE